MDTVLHWDTVIVGHCEIGTALHWNRVTLEHCDTGTFVQCDSGTLSVFQCETVHCHREHRDTVMV